MKLLGGLHPFVPRALKKWLSVHGQGCRSPPISLVGLARICRSGVTPFSSPLGLLLTHSLYFLLHSLVLLWFFGHVPMVCPPGW